MYRVFLSIGGHAERLVGELIVTSAGGRHSQHLWSTEVLRAVDHRPQVVCLTGRLIGHRQSLGLALAHAGRHVVDVT